MYIFVYLLSFLTLSFCGNQFQQVDRPRGVSLTKKILYDPSKDFTCLDGSRTIPFSLVNDDYCDCNDASDEPGTSACPNGMYHCTNAGYKPANIPSSRVNDGLCDCCDGSDEWRNQSLCPNTCVELWKIEKEALKRQMDEANKGFVLRQDYAKAGASKKEERQTSLTGLEEQLNKIKEVEVQLQQHKEAIEAKETEAKEERRKIMLEEQAKKAIEENIIKGASAFSEMDTDKDASLTIKELLAHTELDPDAADNEFTEAEAKGILGNDAIDHEQFMQEVWPNINGTFQTVVALPVEEEEVKKEEELTESSDAEEAAFREEEAEKQAEASDADQADEYDEEEDDEEDHDEDEDEEDFKEEGKSDPPPPAEEAYYDEETKLLIEEANKARDEFKKNQDVKQKIERDMEALKKSLEMDFGPDESFQVMQHQCYELTTMEYKYKLCPFDKTSQAPKNGGSETNLGRWGSWSGPAEAKYSKMKYENGLACWNGPSRSTEVRIRCGIEHKLLSVDEPSRCMYSFEFSTPCACERAHEPELRSKDEL